MLTRAFWRDALERMVSTFAQATLGALPTSLVPQVSIPWWAALVAGGFAALGCLLKCLAATQVGDAQSASLLPAVDDLTDEVAQYHEAAPAARRKRVRRGR